jgi:NAD(P)-dependent dehydrogenase (short-subunit alcohol dehydrogenase family)
MQPEFSGKVALVTGATSGIGSATALGFAKAGAKVVLSGRREREGQSVVRQIQELGGTAMFVRTDVADENSVRSLCATIKQHYGALHAVFSNAGIEGQVGPLTAEQTCENFHQVFDINVLGVLLTMKYCIPLLLSSGGGAIVNNASVAGMVGMPGVAVYVASKHAVLGLTRSTALEYATQGIRVNCVSPAAIETEMYERFVTASGEGAREYMKSIHPVGRIGTAQEVADAVLFLCSAKSSFLTGVNLPVDGGFTAK